eukprot:TRINITY_DN47666_c0_g1_i1.p1 TRINITY_DN47666_c0_g1~~TRINITY_DN47666_c0_g1_i1.p1  ORF type:complete len:380 (-),score=84.21 TRINITY_DN47666_c0_g1_i1:258-1397(-)
MGKKGTAKTAPTSEQEKQRHTCLHSQLHKTKFCLYHLKGACQFGDNCSFAHSCAELQATPDLRKTRLCINFFEGPGCNDPHCTFAHCEEDLRSTDMFYKKTLCMWNEKGKCRNGDQCRFAHGLAELRANQGTEPVSKGSKDKYNSDERMGRQFSSQSGTSCGAASTMSSLGDYEETNSSTTTGATRSHARARGKRGGTGAGAALLPTTPGQQDSKEQARQSVGYPPAEPHNAGVMPMKILPSRNFPGQSNWVEMPTSGPVSTSYDGSPEEGGDAALKEELRKLRASVSALTMRCNKMNDQMYSEALRNESSLLQDKMYAAQALLSQVALRQQLLSQVEQVRKETYPSAMTLASRLGSNRFVPPPALHSSGVNWNFELGA